MMGLSSAAAFAGDLLGFEGARRQNSAASDMSDKQMAFQERMSSTAYQRAVGDMEAAGLNPMLAYSQGGASSPGGSQAPVVNTMAPFANSASNAADVALKLSQADKLQADSDFTRATTPTASPELKDALASRLKEESRNAMWQAKVAQLGYDERAAVYAVMYGTTAAAYGFRKRLGLPEEGAAPLQLQKLAAEVRDRGASAVLKELGVSEAQVYSDFYKSTVGKSMPYVDAGLSSAARAASVVHDLKPWSIGGSSGGVTSGSSTLRRRVTSYYERD